MNSDRETTTTDPLTPAAQAARFDRAAQLVLLALEDDVARSLAEAQGISGHATMAQVRKFLGLQNIRARLCNVPQQSYNDTLAGRRGSGGTVLGWCRAWGALRFNHGGESRGLPALEYDEILGLPSGVVEDG